MECPFLCGFRTSNETQAEYQITAHIELHHTPDSHFAAENEDLKFALALQREEEERVSADARSHENATRSTIEGFGPRKERAVNNAADDDFPYVDCSECEDFVHLVEFNEHMNNHLSLQYSSDTISGKMAELDSGSSTSLHQSTASESSTTIARPVDKHNDRSYGNRSTAAFAEHQSRGTRLGVSFVPSFLCPLGAHSPAGVSTGCDLNTELHGRKKSLVHTHSRTRCLKAYSRNSGRANQQDESTASAETAGSLQNVLWRMK